MVVKRGDKVRVDYEGRLEDGTVFDSSKENGPIEFVVGAGTLIPGFENSVIGMKKGEEKEITIQPKDAYGDNNPNLVKKVPREQVPPEAKMGSLLLMSLPNGMQIPVKITQITAKEATLDFNHPLAGKVLIFKIKLIEIVPGTEAAKITAKKPVKVKKAK